MFSVGIMTIRKIKSIAKVCRMNEVLLVVPYAGTAAFMVTSGFPNIGKLFFLLLAVFAGFSAGNIFNAFVDKDIDSQNPRTNQRPLVKHELSNKEILVLLIVCAIAIIVCTAALNPAYVLMLPLPAGICFGYSLCKRFTWLGHFVLGIAHAICPVSGWIVFGSITDWRAVLFGAVIFFWTFSLDMIYSLQDIEYDIKMGLYSIPAIFGEKVAYTISVFCHMVMVTLFAILIHLSNCGLIFISFAILAESLLLIQYILIIKNKENTKYAFNLNQGFTSLIFIASILDKF